MSLTQFGRTLEELGVNHILARSPQAKGRVERLWGTLQHRLMVELRLAGVSTLEDANAFLPSFILRFNKRFSAAPADPISAFSLSPPAQELERVICFKETRKATKGSTISYFGHTYCLVDARGNFTALQPRSSVSVLIHLDGSLSALYADKRFNLKLFNQPKSVAATKLLKNSRQPHSPGNDHPWKNARLSSRIPMLEPIDRYLDAQANRALWKEIYAQR